MKHSTTRQRFIDVASELFWKQGYEATGMAEILKRTGVGAGSFYYHFNGKEDLLIAVLDNYQRIFPDVITGPAFQATDDPIERIFFILGSYRSLLLENNFRLGCPIGNIALEVSGVTGVSERISRLFELWREAIREALQDAGDRVSPGVDQEELATLVLTVMEGAVMQARSERTIEPFDASIRQLRNYINRLLDPPLFEVVPGNHGKAEEGIADVT